jgi:hypothetical protein
MPYIVVVFMFNDLMRWEVIVHFVNIGGVVFSSFIIPKWMVFWILLHLWDTALYI